MAYTTITADLVKKFPELAGRIGESIEMSELKKSRVGEIKEIKARKTRKVRMTKGKSKGKK